MDFDYKQYPKDEFQIIWASPPCTFYSRLQNCWIGRKKKDGILVTRETIAKDMIDADLLVKRTLEIIEYFNPHFWFMENPQTGKLKDRDVVKGLPFYDVSYCMYSDWGYEKKTRVWTNRKGFKPLICDKTGSCGNMMISETQKLHTERMGTSKTVIDGDKVIRVNTAELRAKYKDYPNLMSRQHKKVLGNGYEYVNGEKVLCNTKKLRNKHKAVVAGGGGSKTGQKCIGGGTNRLERYRVPEDLILCLLGTTT